MTASLLQKAAALAAAVTTSAPAFPSPWAGVPTKLIRKTLLVERGVDRLPVYTLTFEIPRGHSFSGRAQPLENVRIDFGEVVKMVIPNYKPKSYSMSALRESENEFDVTLKIYPNGRASGHLDRLQIGESVHAFGLKNSKVRNPGKFFGGIAYGVGITEILPVARFELEKGDAERVVVFWASRTLADTFWHDQIKELKEKYKEKFEIVYIFSREKTETTEQTHLPTGALHGRIDSSVLKQVFEPRLCLTETSKLERHEARFLVIGTKAMMRMTEAMLSEIGFPFHKHALLQ